MRNQTKVSDNVSVRDLVRVSASVSDLLLPLPLRPPIPILGGREVKAPTAVHPRVIQVGGGGGGAEGLTGSYLDDEEKDNHKSPTAPGQGLGQGLGQGQGQASDVVPVKSLPVVNEGTDIPIKWPEFGAATQVELSTNR